MSMKNLSYIFILLLFFLAISCQESSITDPNTRKTPIVQNDNPDDGEGVSNFYKATNINYYIYEFSSDEFIDSEIEWQNNIQIQRNNILFDTTENKKRIIIDISIHSTIPDFLFAFKDQRVTGISVYVDTLDISNNIINRNFNDLPNSDFEMRLKNLNTNTFDIRSKINSIGAVAIRTYNDNTFEIHLNLNTNSNASSPGIERNTTILANIEGNY
jgi:hypothetical protein